MTPGIEDQRKLPLKALVMFVIATALSSAAAQQISQLAAAAEQPLPVDNLMPPDFQEDFSLVAANGRTGVKWDKQHLLSFGDATEPISLYDKSGTPLFSTLLALDNAARIYVDDFAVTKTGTVAVGATAVSADGALADIIFEMGKNGVMRAVRTSPFYPERICTTDEGTVWAYGYEHDEQGGDRRGHHAMLREFSFEQGLLRSAVDRATVQPLPGAPVTGGRDLQLKCGGKKIVVLNGPNNELIEYDLAQSKVGRWLLPPVPGGMVLRNITGSALIDSGEFFVSFEKNPPEARTGIYRVGLNSSGVVEWGIVTLARTSNGNWFRLLGSDGESLVYARGLKSSTLLWSKATQTEATK